MSQSDSAFLGSIPEFYDRYMGAIFFAPYAREIAQRLSDLEQGCLLEIACGTGIVTRALAERLPREVKILATDLNQAMLDYAATQLSAPNVAWRQVDAQALPLGDASFDAAVCQFGVMFFPDKALSYREMRRVVKPGGRYVFNVWDRIEANGFTEVVHQTVSAIYPNDPPGFLARTPFGYFDTAPISASLRAACFGHVEVEAVNLISRAPSALHAANGLCRGTPLSAEILARDPNGLDETVAAVARALSKRFGSGPIEASMRAHVVTAF